MSNLRILIMGSSGFIGSHLVDVLQNDFYVCGLGGRKTVNQPYDYFSVDIFSESASDILVDILLSKEIDLVINCIGGGWVSTSTKKGLDRLLEFNLRPIVALEGALATNTCLRKSLKKIIHFGSISSYGVNIGAVINERTPKNPKTVHEVVKFESEKQFKKLGETFAIPYLIVQPAQVYGPRDDYSEIYKILKTLRKFPVFPLIGDGKNKMVPMIYVEDVAKTVKDLILKEASGEYILAWANNTWEDFAMTLKEILNVKIFYVPERLFRLSVYCEDRILKFFGLEPLFAYERVDYILGNRVYDSSKVMEETGISITPLKEGLTKTLKSYEKI